MMGVLVGCNQLQEWLLPWWYHHFRKHNPHLPVAFGDLGMSLAAQTWCKERGLFIPETSIPFCHEEKKEVLFQGEEWVGFNRTCSSVYTEQSVWFKKPQLMKQTPFDKTIWIDLDCEILSDITPLGTIPLSSMKLILRSSGQSFLMKIVGKEAALPIKAYNSGVVVYEKNSQLLDFWIHSSRAWMHAFYGDDHVLSFLIFACKLPKMNLPLKYNWDFTWGPNPQTVIRHWMGEQGKTALRLFKTSYPFG